MRSKSFTRFLLAGALLTRCAAAAPSDMVALVTIIVVFCIAAVLAVHAVVNFVLVWIGFYRTHRPMASHLIAFAVCAFGLMAVADDANYLVMSDYLTLLAALVLPTLAAFLPAEIQHRRARALKQPEK